MHFYFFKSTDNTDISGISIFTTSSKKAFALARRYFAKYNFKGEPVILAV